MAQRRIVICENIRSLHNVGAIFRTAECAGFTEVWLGGYTGTPPDRRIEKVSLGAEQMLKWEHAADTVALCQSLIDTGVTLIALEQSQSSQSLFTVGCPTGDFAIVLGNEVEGVTPDVLALCQTHAEIPLYGQKTSLNVSVAAGIGLFHFRPQ